uniref:C2 domain-containing protein n=1 Tax=Oryza barthii TaxID=65489 RepID=A0A0D3FC02_9ORYZ
MSAGGRHRDDCSASPPPSPSPPPSTLLQLLEVTVISAQDLHRRLGRRVRAAYAVAWADAAHKLRTGVDLAGGADPTWNDRFLFRVDEAFLRSDTAAVTVERKLELLLEKWKADLSPDQQKEKANSRRSSGPRRHRRRSSCFGGGSAEWER